MMKEVVCIVQFLQPFDIRKELEIFTEASKEGGLGLVLCQPGQGRAKAGIQCGSTSLTPAQTNYSVTEIELLAILWALEKTAFYTKGAPVIKVYSDHSASRQSILHGVDKSSKSASPQYAQEVE